MQTYEPSAGMHINDACLEAVTLAAKLNEPVRFTFNGILIQALVTDTPRLLIERWSSINEAEQKAYHGSPEGKAARAQREETIRRRQAETDAAIIALPKILRTDNHLDALMNWLRGFVESADDIGVKWNHSEVANLLSGAGYNKNEYVGHKPEWFNTRERMGRYIVGQAINCMKRRMPPHPITIQFTQKYFTLSKKGATTPDETEAK